MKPNSTRGINAPGNTLNASGASSESPHQTDWRSPSTDADKALIADLLEALKPLAEMADGIVPSVPDSHEIVVNVSGSPFARCTVGQLRAARTAIAKAARQ